MARQTITWTATRGRDKGKQFRLTELPADQAERWFIRTMLALGNAGAQLGDAITMNGAAGFAGSFPGLLVQGIQALAGLRWEDSAPLLDEMMGCVQFVVPGQTAHAVPLAPGDACQIEEVRTRLQLRYEVLQLHVGFSLAGALPNSTPSDPAPASAS